MPEEIHNAEYWFGRLENKLDRLAEKLDTTTVTQAQHGERIKSLEQKQASKATTWLALGVGAMAWVPNLVELLGK
ncbi:hypothetical protein [Amycolatopsis sp. NPDC051903]|uniref:hypothetical protein n=1 Tax=Amycolatopsis sp. NPDC051903 TaxID=3363936 RepID=UPI0037B809D2